MFKAQLHTQDIFVMQLNAIFIVLNLQPAAISLQY